MVNCTFFYRLSSYINYDYVNASDGLVLKTCAFIDNFVATHKEFGAGELELLDIIWNFIILPRELKPDELIQVAVRTSSSFLLFARFACISIDSCLIILKFSRQNLND